MERHIQNYWKGFLKDSALPSSTDCYGAFSFGSNPNEAAHLLSLILAGDKTATSSAVFEYEATGTPIPEPGSLSIVLDGHGQPACIIETHAVQKLPFSEMNFALCSKEGEDDNLKSWQTKHLKFFKEISQEFGQKFTQQSEIIFEEFRVIYSSLGGRFHRT